MDATAHDMNTQIPFEIEVENLKEMSDAGAPFTIVDVREQWEIDTCKFDDSLHVPMNQIPYNVDKIPTDNPVVVICHHGVRSMHVMSFLRNHGFDNATSLRGGIDAWAKRIDPSMATY